MYTKRLEDIPLNEIVPNRFQPRIHFDDVKIESLAKSIMTYGVLEPIIVRPLSGKYEIIAGERRFKASKIAGKSTIPAIIVDFDDKESIELALLENIQRQELTAIEEAIAYRRILDMGQITQEQLAKKTGKSQPNIANKMRLLALDDETQDALINHRISERHARSLLKLSGTKDELEMLERIIAERLTVRDTDREIAKLLEKRNVENKKINDFFEHSSKKIEEKNKEENGENNFMDIEKIMQEARDINATEAPKDLNKFVTTPSPYDTILEPTETQVNDIADIMGSNEEANKFVNVINPEEIKEEPKGTQHPTVSFDNIFNKTFDVPTNSEITSNEQVMNVSPILETVSDTVQNKEPLSLETPTTFETLTPSIPDVEAIEIPTEVKDMVDFIPSVDVPLQIPEVETPISIVNEDPSVSLVSDIPEFTSTIAETAPNFENVAPPIPEVESMENLSEISSVDISIPEENIETPEVMTEISNVPTVDSVPSFEHYGSIESLDIPDFKTPSFSDDEPSPKDFSKVLDIIKNCSEQIKELGYEIKTSEFDLENIYQLTITIDK